MMDKFNNIYLGIVVQNNDPKKRGRVKVYVPSVSPAVYSEWIGDNTNKSFKFINNDLNPIMKELKKTLPWAEIAAPLTSEDASGRYNSYASKSSVSDANKYENFLKENTASSGEIYDQSSFRLKDAFDKNENNINNVNPYSYMYKPNTYSNKAKGSFGIPSVGAHVYVFFREGDYNFPVVMAAAYGINDWQGIYDNDVDYPGKFENFDASLSELDENVKTYRNKYVLNQKGGAIEINNTDFNEKVRITQYSGSFKEMNNHTSIELASKNDQKLVLADSYHTTKGFRNEYTGKNLDEIIVRDKYKKIGNLNKEIYEQWRDTFAPIQDTKQLFPKRRTFSYNVTDNSGNVIIKRNSIKQQKVGKDPEYPVFSDQVFALNNKNTFEDSGFSSIASSINIGSIVSGFLNPIFENVNDLVAKFASPAQGQQQTNATDSRNYTKETGLPIPVTSSGGTYDEDPNVNNLKDQIIQKLEELMDLEKEMGVGGNEFVEIAKNKIETIGMVMNDYGSIRVDPVGKLVTSEMIVGTNGVYKNREPAALIEYVDVQDMPGGTYNLNVANKYNLMVGAGGLQLKSSGPTNVSGSVTNIAGDQVNIGSEYGVNIDGDYVNISANILKLRNKRKRQIFVEGSLGVQNNIIVGGGLHVEGEMSVQHITAPAEFTTGGTSKASGQPTKGLVSSCVIGFIPRGATVNVSGVTLGSGFIKFDEAMPVVTNSIDLIAFNRGKVQPFPDPNSIEVYPHSHTTAGIPMTLVDSNKSLRNSTIKSKMSHGCNVPASSQFNTDKSQAINVSI
jgi:hypothetical protein